MLIAGCLLILVVLSVFSVILGSSFMGIIVEQTISNTVVVNGSATTFTVDNMSFVFNIDPIAGMVATLAVWIGIALLFGIRIMGSGLSDDASRIATMITIYTAIWTILSTLVIPLVFGIEIFGAIIYVVLTIAYAVGVVQKMGSSD